jgi:hypothetical protein
VREAIALARARAGVAQGLPSRGLRRRAADRWRTLTRRPTRRCADRARRGVLRGAVAGVAAVSPQLYIDTTRGTIQVELDVIHAPVTSQSVMALARRGYFDGIVFHRIVPNFVVQAGDPRGDGEGGPGYAIRDELSDLPFLRGTVGMALSWPGTAGASSSSRTPATTPRRALRHLPGASWRGWRSSIGCAGGTGSRGVGRAPSERPPLVVDETPATPA